MKIKRKFALYNIIMLITPIVLIGVISICFLVVFIMKYPVNELNITRAALLHPSVFSQALGEFFKRNPSAILYCVIWAFICVTLVVLSTTIVTHFMSKSVEKPISELSRAADHVRNGHLDFEVLGSDYDEINALCGSFDAMRCELKRARAVEENMKHERSMLLANISHDLKTPVTSIKGYVDGIRDGVADTKEKLERYLDTISAKADAIDDMVNNLSVFSRLELSKMVFNFETADINELLRSFIADYKLDIEKHGVTLTEHISDETARVRLDREKMSRVFSNITDNAVKYRSAAAPTLEISSIARDKGVYISFTDNGIGIDESEIKKVFEGFYRADASRSVRGSGLGLGIVKQIVEKHGGKIWLRSGGVGKGTTAEIYLPLSEEGET